MLRNGCGGKGFGVDAHTAKHVRVGIGRACGQRARERAVCHNASFGAASHLGCGKKVFKGMKRPQAPTKLIV